MALEFLLRLQRDLRLSFGIGIHKRRLGEDD